MILLRYGIRCSLHYSVPLTLGLIAYTGSWQGVARNLMTESKTGGQPNPADAKTGDLTASNDGTAKSTTDSAASDRPEGESIAMIPDTGESPRSLSIPRADSRRGRGTEPESASNGNSRPRIDAERPPRDRDIDATGHQAQIAQSEPRESGPPLTAGMAAGAAGLAFVAVNSQNVVSEQVAFAGTKPERAVEKSPDPVSPQTALAAEASESRPGTEPDNGASTQASLSAKPSDPPAIRPEAEGAEAPSAEPAHLNPQIRAIAAEVPSATVIARNVTPEAAKPAEKPDIQTGNQANETDRTTPEIQKESTNGETAGAVVESAPKPDSTQAPETENAVVKVESKPESSQTAAVDKKTVDIPDVVIAQQGESWNRIAARIYGDEKMAETIWRENRDAHGGAPDAMPIAGRMVRLPESGKQYSIPNSGQTQLARTAR